MTLTHHLLCGLMTIYSGKLKTCSKIHPPSLVRQPVAFLREDPKSLSKELKIAREPDMTDSVLPSVQAIGFESQLSASHVTEPNHLVITTPSCYLMLHRTHITSFSLLTNCELHTLIPVGKQRY